MSRRRYLVSYDISEPKRLRKTYKTMLDFGDHLQYSVFLCELNDSELVILKTQLADVIHHEEDQVIISDFGPANDNNSWRNRVTAMGRPFIPPERVRVV